jgi:hypothetical protein
LAIGSALLFRKKTSDWTGLRQKTAGENGLNPVEYSSPLKKSNTVAERRKPPGFARNFALRPDGLRRAATFFNGLIGELRWIGNRLVLPERIGTSRFVRSRGFPKLNLRVDLPFPRT